MGLAHERAGILGIAAKPADVIAQVFDDLLTLVCALAKGFAKPLIIDVRGRILVAGDAVDRRRDQRVQRRDFVLAVVHALTPCTEGIRAKNA